MRIGIWIVFALAIFSPCGRRNDATHSDSISEAQISSRFLGFDS